MSIFIFRKKNQLLETKSKLCVPLPTESSKVVQSLLPLTKVKPARSQDQKEVASLKKKESVNGNRGESDFIDLTNQGYPHTYLLSG